MRACWKFLDAMEYFGFDDLLDEGPRNFKRERELFDHRALHASRDALSTFRVLPILRDRAISLVQDWRNAGISYVNLHLLVGLAYMHACAEHRGGSVVFPTEVLNFVNASTLAKNTAYPKVISTYHAICDSLRLPKLLVHAESGIRRIVATATVDLHPQLLEQLVTAALGFFGSIAPELQRPSRAPRLEILLGACTELAFRKIGGVEFSRASLRLACLQSENSNSLELWAKKIAEKFPGKIPAIQKTKINYRRIKKEISEKNAVVEIADLAGPLVESADQLLEF